MSIRKTFEERYYAWKGKKLVGNLILSASTVVCLTLGCRLFLVNSTLPDKIFEFVIFFFLFLAAYNWLIGRQKGHFFHFIANIAVFLFSSTALFKSEIGPLHTLVLASIVICLWFLRTRYFLDFKRDYNFGIFRNYFE